MVSIIESILSKYRIEQPYFHGGKYNCKAMINFMDYKHPSNVIDEIRDFIFSIPPVDRCPNKLEEWINKFKKILSVIQNPTITAMKLWRGTGNSVSAKPHVIEDHIVEQIIRFSGIKFFCEDFIEKSHQDGIIDHARTKNSISQEAKRTQYSQREHI